MKDEEPEPAVLPQDTQLLQRRQTDVPDVLSDFFAVLCWAQLSKWGHQQTE